MSTKFTTKKKQAKNTNQTLTIRNNPTNHTRTQTGRREKLSPPEQKQRRRLPKKLRRHEKNTKPQPKERKTLEHEAAKEKGTEPPKQKDEDRN